ncbi:DUF2637 domain-containing protein [Kitasatospora sp. NPDC057223]|uniref:DUF2637 domain-containing protein n=1 Tax=Kitasatospora sp. NPDC057223 TaxID=3346055 RepID=UPI003643B6CB
MTRIHWVLVTVLMIGALSIALIGLGGSYIAVRDVAIQKDLGAFARVFPIGVDAGILVLLALDLYLARLRIPFPLLRPTAWGLTVATIAFNASTSWPDPIGVGMHAVIPVLFIIISEAGRHAIARLAKLSSDGDRTIERIRLMRWILAPGQTWAMWRRMQLWEIRKIDDAIRLEQTRLTYETLLRDSQPRWRKKRKNRGLPAAANLPLELAKLGVPLSLTYQDGLAAAGVATRPMDQLLAFHRESTPAPAAPSVEQPPALAQDRAPAAPALAPPVPAPQPGAQGEAPDPREGTERLALAEGPAPQPQPASESFAYPEDDPADYAYAGAEDLDRRAVPQTDHAYSQVKALAGRLAGPDSGFAGTTEGQDRQAFGFAGADPDGAATRKALAGEPRIPEPTRAAASAARSERTADVPAAPAAAVNGSVATASPDDGEAGKIVIPEVWLSAFTAWMDRHGRYPSEEELAQYLYNLPEKERVRARGKDSPVSKRSVERYYGELKKKFPIADQPQLELEGSGR